MSADVCCYEGRHEMFATDERKSAGEAPAFVSVGRTSRRDGPDTGETEGGVPLPTIKPGLPIGRYGEQQFAGVFSAL